MPDKALTIALPLIKKWEGCRLKAYSDLGGRVTIGYGHTGKVNLGDEWPEWKAEEQLIADASGVYEQVKALVKVPLNDNQMAALISFAYNLGLFNLKRSGLLKFLNMGKTAQAADQFLLWNHVGLYVVKGLTARRQDERALFLKEPSK